MTKTKNLDPRTKLLMVLILSTFALIFSELRALSLVLLTSIFIGFVIGSDFKSIVSRLKKLIYLILLIAIVQSLFTKTGKPIISIGRLTLITDYGIERSLEFILRIAIIVVSAGILTTSSSRDIVQGLIEMKIHYEIAFMVSIAIRFLPILKEEMMDSIIAIQLRGIDFKETKLRDKIKIYKYIFLPIVANSILKARELASAMEMRGFRAYSERSNFRILKMKKLDYIIVSLSLILSIFILIIAR